MFACRQRLSLKSRYRIVWPAASSSACMWNCVFDELPDWNRSQLSSCCVATDDDADDDSFVADADVEAVAKPPATRLRAVSISESFTLASRRELSSDSSRCESGRSPRAGDVESSLTERVALAETRL